MRLFLHAVLSAYRAAFAVGAILWHAPRTMFFAVRDQGELYRQARLRGCSIGRCVRSLAIHPLRSECWLLSRVPRLSGWDVELERRAAARDLVAAHRVASATDEWTPQTALARRLQIICWQALVLRVAGGETSIAIGMETVGDAAVRLPALERLACQCEIVGLGWERRETGPAYNLYALQARLREASDGARSRVRFWDQLRHPRRTLVKLHAARSVDLRIGRQANEEFPGEVQSLRDVIDLECCAFRGIVRRNLGLRP